VRPAGCRRRVRVAPTYTEGRLTAVPGYSGSISYHPNGLVNQVVHGNGTTDTQANDASAIRRPASITSRKAGVEIWKTGSYAYDLHREVAHGEGPVTEAARALGEGGDDGEVVHHQEHLRPQRLVEVREGLEQALRSPRRWVHQEAAAAARRALVVEAQVVHLPAPGERGEDLAGDPGIAAAADPASRQEHRPPHGFSSSPGSRSSCPAGRAPTSSRPHAGGSAPPVMGWSEWLVVDKVPSSCRRIGTTKDKSGGPPGAPPPWLSR
jgi:hypothetical protein